MIPYKRLDLVISAGEAVGAPVVLAGAGPLWSELQQRGRVSPVPVVMIERPSDALLFALYQRARALVFPAVEDFGIMPVEAMAAGAPVVVRSLGGAIESVQRLGGGAVVSDYAPESWRAAIAEADSVTRASLRPRTRLFSNAAFQSNLKSWVSTALATSPVRS
jgi:glycosyltransferase involved in cell wall biosynthesis